jgi:hypothetical protein
MNNQAKLRLEIFPSDHREFGPCECCGNMTHRVWGWIYSGESARAAYFVEWTPHTPVIEANFDLIIGRWGDDTSANDQVSVALEFRKLATGPAYRVIDAVNRSYAKNDLVGRALAREDVLQSSSRNEVFACCEVIYEEDPRLAVLRDARGADSLDPPALIPPPR